MMPEFDKMSVGIHQLEYALIKQFRLMQSLIEVTQKEKNALLTGETTLMRLVEDKEVLLDQLGMIENDRRTAVQDLMLLLGVRSESSSIKELVPFLDEEEATRIERLADGVTSLVWQARELNQINQVVANNKMDWLRATQYFLIGASKQDGDYRPPVSRPVSRESADFGIGIRA
jgi:flagellar biosynthesis/type III secretory pathway chaperone